MPPNDIDVTDKVSFQNNDDECLPVTKCVCGKEYTPWEFIIGIYRDWADTCDNCGRKLYFKNNIQVFEVHDD